MPAIPVDAVCAFLAVCVAVGEEPFAEGDRVVSPETGRAALDVLAGVLSVAHPASRDWNPPRLLEHMASEDDVAYCPLAFGYSNYARPGFRPRPVHAAPGPAGSDGVPRGTLGGTGLAVSASSGAVGDAATYAAFVASPEVQRTVYVEGGGQPGHRGAWTDDAVNAATGDFFRDTLPALEAAYLRPRHDGFIAWQDEAGRLLHEWLGDPRPAGVDGVLEAMDAAHRRSRRSPAEASP
jgi:multiple sugar transport system substrate-binding protein